MTRQDFCQMLSRVKQNATVRICDSLPYIFQLSARKIEIIETGSENFNMTECFLFIQMCGSQMEFEWEYCNNISDLRAAIIKARENLEISQKELAKISNIHINIIKAFEEGRCTLKVDSFLRIADALNVTITIE